MYKYRQITNLYKIKIIKNKNKKNSIILYYLLSLLVITRIIMLWSIYHKLNSKINLIELLKTFIDQEVIIWNNKIIFNW